MQYFPETFTGMCCGRYQEVSMYSPSAVGLAFGQVLDPALRGAAAACRIDFDP